MINRVLFLFGSVLLFSSCSSYVTPPAPADFQTLNSPVAQSMVEPRPLVKFPAYVAITQIQGNSLGRGKWKYPDKNNPFALSITKHLQGDERMNRLRALPGVAESVVLNKLIAPPFFKSSEDLRTAAKRLRADLLLIYTFDTEVTQNDAMPILTLATLGLSPSKMIEAESTASAVLIDVKTGFIYGTAQGIAKEETISNGWYLKSSMESVEDEVEHEAFSSLLSKIENVWGRVYERYR